MFTQEAILITHPTILNATLFESGGYAVISTETYEDSRITLTITEPTGKLSLIPKYLSDDNYLFVSVNEDMALHIGAEIKGAQKTYGIVDLSDKYTDNNSLVVESNGSHFMVRFNEEDVFMFQAPAFVNGSIRIHGDTGAHLLLCNVEEPQSEAWEGNGYLGEVETKRVEINGDVYMKIKGSSQRDGKLHLQLPLNSGESTLSFAAKGVGECRIEKTDGTVLHELSISTYDLTRFGTTFNLPQALDAMLVFEATDELIVGKNQVESGAVATSYIANTDATAPRVRIGSELSFPLKEKFDGQTGSIYLKLTTLNGAPANQVLFETEDGNLSLRYAEGELSFDFGPSAAQLMAPMDSESSYEIMASWDRSKVTISLNEESQTVLNESAGSYAPERLIFADGENLDQEYILEEWALFNRYIGTTEGIAEQLPYASIQSLFEGGISGKQVNWSEIPVAPNDYSPILVEKEDGTVMQKVSFFDEETGDYRTWNREAFYYDGRSDFIELSYANINDQFRGIGLWTEDGEKIGEPYRIEGKRLYFEMYEGTREYHRNNWLYATYQVNDTYTIEPNIEAPDGYRIDFAKHDGGKRVVIQEGNRYGESAKLATMVELNPIQNQNHEGFLYLTETANTAENFRITASRDRLVADGAESTTVFMEVLDHQGNYLSYPNLEVTARYGFIARLPLKESADSQRRAGQYLYQYTAPFIERKREGEWLEDHIWVIDPTSNVGMSHKIILAPAEAAARHQLTADEKERLKEKEELINAIITYESVERYNAPELVDILDLNGDGRITTDDIVPLETNEKDAELTVRINQLREWVATKDALKTS